MDEPDGDATHIRGRGAGSTPPIFSPFRGCPPTMNLGMMARRNRRSLDMANQHPASHRVVIVAALVDKLPEHGCSEPDCQKFLGGNFYRVFKQVWK